MDGKKGQGEGRREKIMKGRKEERRGKARRLGMNDKRKGLGR